MNTNTLLLAALLATTAAAGADAFGWGENRNGNLGEGTTTDRHTPTAVLTAGALLGKTLTAVENSIGGYHTLALASDGKVFAWGFNSYGLLGDGTTTDRLEPVAVDMTGALLGKTVTAIAAGRTYSLVLTADNKLYTWGDNAHGQLGDGTTTAQTTAVAVDMTGALSGKTIARIAAGGFSAAVLTTDGLVFTWGRGDKGQLGNGGTANSSVPVALDMSGVLATKTVTQISGGYEHFLALTTDGRAYGWGTNADYQLGDGATAQKSSPVAVDTSGVLFGKRLVAVSAAYETSMALSADGKIYGWGYNRYGALGDGTSAVHATTPVATDMSGVLSGKSITAISAGERHTIALASDGELFAWGWNDSGQVGDGTTTDRLTPVAVDMSGALAGQSASAISARTSFTATLASPSVSTITPACRFTYAANFGWLNWRTNPLALDAPVIETTMLHGKVYSANVGWIDLGDGTPSTTSGYSQTGGDIGVNHNGAGALSGYAYGANIGWVYFDPTIAAPPRVDLVTGALSGYSYSANCGWINLAGVKTRLHPGADLDVLAGGGSGDGIADSWEIERATAAGLGSSLSLLGANANSDFDGDGISDRDEYLADTNPFSTDSRFAVTDFQFDPLTGNIDLDWTGSTRRSFTIWCSSDLQTWTQVGSTQTGGSAALSLGGPSASHLFFRVKADVPLSLNPGGGGPGI